MTLTNFRSFDAGFLDLSPGLSITLDGNSTLRISDGLYFRGGTINVNGVSNLTLSAALQGAGRYGIINLGTGGTFNITDTGLFEMSANASLTNPNWIKVKGAFGGSGTVSGTGTTYIFNDGILSPGNALSTGTLIASAP